MEMQMEEGTRRSHPQRKSRGEGKRMVCVGVVALVIGVCGIVAVGVPWGIALMKVPVRDPTSYAIVFDAGSSGTRMYIYTWDGTKTHGWNSTPDINDVPGCYPPSSMSSFENDPSKAGPSLASCLDQAKDSIPADYHQSTQVYLAATAGMRLLNAKNSTVVAAIFDSVKTTFKGYPFNSLPERVRIISDMEEGIFAWMTVNYLNVKLDYIKKLNGSSNGTLGTVDLGGASAQISFVPDDPNVLSNYTLMVRMFGTNYTIYSHSYLCYGKNEAYRRMLVQLFKDSGAVVGSDGVFRVNQPCAQRDAQIDRTYSWLVGSTCTQAQTNDTFKANNVTFVGTSETAKCTALVPQLFDKSKCSFGQCSFDGVYQPQLKGLFLAISAFFYTYQFYNYTGVSASTTLESFQTSVDTYCNKTWAEVTAIPVPDSWKPYLPQYCFDGQYTITMLKTLGFNSATWTKVLTAETMQNYTVGWTMGLLLNEINGIAAIPMKTVSQLPIEAFGVLISLFILMVLLSICLLAMGCQRQRSDSSQ